MSSPLSLPVPRLSLTLQDGWMPEDEEAKVNRGTDKPSTWFRFSAQGFAVAPLVRSDCYGFVVPSADDA